MANLERALTRKLKALSDEARMNAIRFIEFLAASENPPAETPVRKPAGRPGKEKAVEGADVPKRGRGRPRKIVPLSAETVEAAPKKRGRPRKNPEATAVPVKKPGRAPKNATAPKRGRGRPRKVQPDTAVKMIVATPVEEVAVSLENSDTATSQEEKK